MPAEKIQSTNNPIEGLIWAETVKTSDGLFPPTDSSSLRLGLKMRENIKAL